MGTWGFSVLADDTALDVYDDYINKFNDRKGPEEIRSELLSEYEDTVDDPDDAPVFWLALARAQWDCGQLDPDVLAKVEAIAQAGIGLERWEEMGIKSVTARQRALDRFLGRLRAPNHRPRRPRQPPAGKPIFQPGDCVSVHLPDGHFAAILVVHHPLEASDGASATGHSNVVVLEYYHGAKPTLEVFRRRQWAIRQSPLSLVPQPIPLAFCVIKHGFRASRDAYEFVGRIELSKSEPNEPKNYAAWGTLPKCLMYELRRVQKDRED